jgi:hypothetical protein
MMTTISISNRAAIASLLLVHNDTSDIVGFVSYARCCRQQTNDDVRLATASKIYGQWSITSLSRALLYPVMKSFPLSLARPDLLQRNKTLGLLNREPYVFANQLPRVLIIE